MFDRLAAEKLCDVPSLNLQEESTTQQLNTESSTLFQSIQYADNEFDVDNLFMPSPAVAAQSSAFYATPDTTLDLEPHLQAMCYPPGDTLQHFSGDGPMEGLFSFGNQNALPEMNGGITGLPWYGMVGQTF